MKPNESNMLGANDPEPDFSKMSGDELEKFLETAAEQMRQKFVEQARRAKTNPYPGGFKIEIILNKDFCGFRCINLQTLDYVDFKDTRIPASVLLRCHSLLVEEASCLKKAWLLMVALYGRHQWNCDEEDLLLPDYSKFDYKRLKLLISDLKENVNAAGEFALLDWKSGESQKTISWLANRYDQWDASQSTVHCIGRVYEVEQEIGSLGHRRIMDCPPYAQVLMQSSEGAAIRHPEYHLASDMALLYNLFLDSIQLAPNFSEPSQSLGRSVILTCFNLLEAFITGLAATFVWENPNAPRDTLQQLKGHGPDGRYLNWRLDEKFERYPSLITGKSGWNINQPPFQDLFTRVKAQRNAMTHPSMPYQSVDNVRIENESRFHDITLDGVHEIVGLTSDAICQVWQFVHGKPKPRWLRLRQEDGRFPHVKFRLATSENITSDNS